MSVIAWLALGSNIGDSLTILRLAAEELTKLGSECRASRVYRSRPMYVEQQPDFLNAVVRMETDLAPHQLLKQAKAVESKLGRVERERNGPREIDIDLIAWGNLQYTFVQEGKQILSIPHPRAHERTFVLLPMLEIDPLASLAGLGLVSDILTKLDTTTLEATCDALLSIPGD